VPPVRAVTRTLPLADPGPASPPPSRGPSSASLQRGSPRYGPVGGGGGGAPERERTRASGGLSRSASAPSDRRSSGGAQEASPAASPTAAAAAARGEGGLLRRTLRNLSLNASMLRRGGKAAPAEQPEAPVASAKTAVRSTSSPRKS
jgi:hypothetical protein